MCLLTVLISRFRYMILHRWMIENNIYDLIFYISVTEFTQTLPARSFAEVLASVIVAYLDLDYFCDQCIIYVKAEVILMVSASSTL